MSEGASQDDLDAMLRELGGAAEQPIAPQRQADPNAETMPAGIGQDDIDALLSEIATITDGGEAKLNRDQTRRIDAVLEHMQAPKGGAPSANLGLSSEDLEDLVAKHTPGPDQPVVPETAISQEDIDDLVAQLTAVVGGTGAIAATEVSRDSKSRLMQPGSSAAAKAVPAAAQTNKPGAKPPTTKITPASKPRAQAVAQAVAPARSARPQHATPEPALPTLVGGGAAAIGVLAPAEVRGARWLLLAAVLLLAVCATGMGLMVRTLASLSTLLRVEETRDLQDADRFALALTAARNQLASQDPLEAATGVESMRKLRTDFPMRNDELTLELARHWRARNAHHKATLEYALISERAARSGDPRIVLEYAETLLATGARDDAARQLYTLLAREQAWLSREDTLGHPKPVEELARDRDAVQRAHLLLGELLGPQPGTTP